MGEEKKKYIIGLDLGIDNVGWSILDAENNSLIDYGVVLYQSSSDAKLRRGARAARRLKKRRNHRIERLALLFNNKGINPQKSIDPDLLQKRIKGLNERIELQDVVNIVYYLATHRGYIPFNVDNEEKATVELTENEYPCQYLSKRLNDFGKYRDMPMAIKFEDNIRELKKLLETQKQYYQIIDDNLIEEIIKIISSKRKFYEGPGGPKINQLTPYGRFSSKKDLNNLDSNKYLYEKLIGKCKISINEKVAPSANFFVEEFNFFNDFINTKVINPSLLEEEYRNKVNENGKFTEKTILEFRDYILNKEAVSFEKMIKDILNTNLNNIEGYRIDKEFKPNFSKFEIYKYIVKQFKDLKPKWLFEDDKRIYNQVIYVLTVVPSSELIEEMLKDRILDYNFSDEEISILANIKKKKNNDLKYHSLSESVIKRALNDMKNTQYQYNYMQLMKKYDYEKEAREYFQKNYTTKTNSPYRIEKKYIDDLISNPQVKKTLRKAISVINTIIEKMNGYPEAIAVESVREMNGEKKRYQLINEQKENEKRRFEAKEFLRKHNYTVNETNIEKVIYYFETEGHCIYCNKPISENEVLTLEIEHILPISHSFDDSSDNKTISCSTCNNLKDKRTPYEMLSMTDQFESFKKRVSQYKISEAKKKNLLYQGEITKYQAKFINRNLRDTAYGSMALIDEINRFNAFIEYKEGSDKRIKVVTIPGQLTNKIRLRMGLEEKDRNTTYHHAVDASIISSIANTNLGKWLIDAQNDPAFVFKNKNDYPMITNYIQRLDLPNKEDIKRINNENTHYSYEIRKNPQQQLSNANIIKLKKIDDTYFKISQIDNIYERNFNDKKVAKDFEDLLDESNTTKQLLCYKEDKSLFELIKGIYYRYKGEKLNPFVSYCIESNGLTDSKEFNYLIHGIRKPSKNNSGPIVKTLRYIESINMPFILEKKKTNSKSNRYGEFVVSENKSIIGLDSLSQYRTDVYFDRDESKFAFLPIYCVSVNLHTREINKDDKYYQQMFNKYIGNKNVIFIGSIYNGEWIRVTKRKDKNILEGKYKGWDKSNNCLDFYPNGNMQKNPNHFTRSDLRIEIFSFDILGKRYKRLDSNDFI